MCSCNYIRINGSPREPGYVLIFQTAGVDPDQLAYALFVIKYVNLYQQTGSNNLIG